MKGAAQEELIAPTLCLLDTVVLSYGRNKQLTSNVNSELFNAAATIGGMSVRPSP